MAATTTISLELEEPRIRREAFPWGAADVEMCADLRVARAAVTATRVHLPSVVDLSTLQQPHVGDPATTGGNRVEEIKLLEVEVLGCDLGITFTLGTAIVDVPLKLKPSLAQNACRSDPFRASVTDDAGARIGTLSGAFIARRQDHVALRGGGEAKASEDRSCSAGGVGQEWPPEGDGMPGQQVKSDDAKMEDKAIELLGMASKILAASNSYASRRARPVEDTAAAGILAREGPAETGGKTGARTQIKQKQAAGCSDVESKRAPKAKQLEDVLDLPPSTNDYGEGMVRVPTAGFRFEPTTGSVAWQRVAAVNVSKVEREGDLRTLKQFLAEVAVGRVDMEDIDANPGLKNAFRLAQLQTQYVVHCQQVLQRQCGGLQTAVSSMELEVEGNTQGVMAMKNRVRLFRKESRKQDKIISGYASMLRRHNPGLAAKVVLDDKGKLKVFKADEATRRWEKTRRRRRRGRQGAHGDNHGLQVLRVQQSATDSSSDEKGDTGNSYPGRRSRTSLSDSREGDRSKNLPAIADNLSRQGVLTATPANAPDGRVTEDSVSEGIRLSRRDEGHIGSTDNAQKEFVLERDRFVDTKGNWNGLTPPEERGGDGDQPLHGHGDDAGSGRWTFQRPVGTSGESSEGKTRLEDVNEARRHVDTTLSPKNKTEETMARVGSQGKDSLGAHDSLGYVPERNQEKLPVADTEERVENVTSRPGEELGQHEFASTVDRTPKMVTVVVKPMKPSTATPSSPRQRKLISSSSHQDDNQSSPSAGEPRHRQDKQGAGIEDERDGEGYGGASYEEGGHYGEIVDASHGTSSMAQRERNDNPTGFGDRRSLDAARERRVDSASRFSAFALERSPIASASRLGLEEEGLPDVSGFDLDDISEIDAGGEWGGVDGVEGSLSS